MAFSHLDELPTFLQSYYEEEDSFDAHLRLYLYTNEYDREHFLHDRNLWSEDDAPGLVVSQTTDSESDSPSVEPAEGHSQVPLMDLSESKRLDDSLTYPQVPKDNLPRHPHLRLNGAAGRVSSGISKGSSNRQHSSGRRNANVDRPRRLQDPEQTAQCVESGQCPKCRDLSKSHSYQTCIRKTLSGTLSNDVRDMWPNDDLEEAILREPHIWTGKRRLPLYVMLPAAHFNVSPSLLEVCVEQYEMPQFDQLDPAFRNINVPRFTFRQDAVPSHEALRRWAEGLISNEPPSNFRQGIEQLLMTYYVVGTTTTLPKHTLVKQVHSMNCMYRIWREPYFQCSDGQSMEMTLPLPAQATLRHIAKRAMESLELDILKQLDSFFMQKNAMVKKEALAVWASLWQLIFIYVELLDRKDPIDTGRERSTHCHSVTARLLMAVAVFYGGHFRSKSKLEQVEQSIDIIFNSTCRPGMKAQFKQATELRNQYFQELQDFDDSVSMMLKSLIIDKEMSLLGKKRRARPHPKVVPASPTSMLPDADDEFMEY